MTIGPDIKEILSEIGTSFTIKKDSGDVSGEYLDFVLNTQATKPFIREFFLETMFSYDTQVDAGDLIELIVPEEHYLVANLTVDLFENSLIKKDGVVYKCNVSGELFRPSGEADWPDSTYQKVLHWNTVKDPCYGLLTSPMQGAELNIDSPVGYLNLEKQELYLPSSIGVQEEDRYQPVSGEYYMVTAVKKRRYPNMDLALLSEDTR